MQVPKAPCVLRGKRQTAPRKRQTQVRLSQRGLGSTSPPFKELKAVGSLG